MSTVAIALESQQITGGFSAVEAITTPETQLPQCETVDIEEIVKWLEELWLGDEELRNTINAEEWQKFIESVNELWYNTQ